MSTAASPNDSARETRDSKILLLSVLLLLLLLLLGFGFGLLMVMTIRSIWDIGVLCETKAVLLLLLLLLVVVVVVVGTVRFHTTTRKLGRTALTEASSVKVPLLLLLLLLLDSARLPYDASVANDSTAALIPVKIDVQIVAVAVGGITKKQKERNLSLVECILYGCRGHNTSKPVPIPALLRAKKGTTGQ